MFAQVLIATTWNNNIVKKYFGCTTMIEGKEYKRIHGIKRVLQYTILTSAYSSRGNILNLKKNKKKVLISFPL
jgi:hypothetical protein